MSNIIVRGEKLISRPIAVVQSQFTDMAHHERTGVHSELGVSNVRPSADGCRFTGHRRVMGKMRESENELQRHPDGSSTLRSVAGPNRGLTIKQTFEAQGPDRTLVRVEVNLPVKGLLRLLSPLVRSKLRKDVAMALEEDRADLEERGYPAS
jgi:hypothetical protein